VHSHSVKFIKSHFTRVGQIIDFSKFREIWKTQKNCSNLHLVKDRIVYKANIWNSRYKM